MQARQGPSAKINEEVGRCDLPYDSGARVRKFSKPVSQVSDFSFIDFSSS